MKIPKHEREDEVGGIDLTPLIDVVFQLLLFFMLTATFQNDERDLSISVPEAAHGNAIQDLPLVVGVRRDGAFTVDSNVLDREELRQVLVRALRQNPKQKVIVRAHREAATQHPVSVLDICSGLGIETSLATAEPGAH